jgi:hypothetical protein
LRLSSPIKHNFNVGDAGRLRPESLFRLRRASGGCT